MGRRLFCITLAHEPGYRPNHYTLHVHGCGNYSELIFIDSKGWNRRIAGYATVPATRLSVKISR